MVDLRGMRPAARLALDVVSNLLAAVLGFAGEDAAKS